jgi:Ca2+/Na+ antiporter
MKIWHLIMIMIFCFFAGYAARMYHHPIKYQTEQERYDAAWYKEKINNYVPNEIIKQSD